MRETKSKIYAMTICSLFAAVLCICSPFSVPFGPVSLSLTLFLVMLISIILKPKMSFLAVCLYILIGACGLPVFSGFGSGLSHLAGPTGGYVWSYAIAAIVISYLTCGKPTALRIFISCLLGMAICYIAGTVQYIKVTQTPDVRYAIYVCVLIFLPFDIIKALAATLCANKMRKIMRCKL